MNAFTGGNEITIFDVLDRIKQAGFSNWRIWKEICKCSTDGVSYKQVRLWIKRKDVPGYGNQAHIRTVYIRLMNEKSVEEFLKEQDKGAGI